MNDYCLGHYKGFGFHFKLSLLSRLMFHLALKEFRISLPAVFKGNHVLLSFS